MDKRKSILNISTSIFFKILTVGMSIIVKRLLILHCGNEVNGLNALYLSIIGFLSVAELGIGSAITFCMYKPIVEENFQQVSALYQLFRKIYTIVAIIILAVGLIITPFIHILAKDYADINANLYSTFVLMLISVVITYFYGAKTSLLNAHKNNYITTVITSGGIIIQYIFQIITLIVSQSFEGYLICRIVAALVQWIITNLVTSQKYSALIIDKPRLDQNIRHQLARSIKAMFMHKVGYLLVNTIDSLIISAFVGVVALGYYSNYIAILSSTAGIISLVFSSLVSVIGHLYVQSTKERMKWYCETFYMLNFVLGAVFYLGYYAIADDLVAILFGDHLIVEKYISFMITLNGFVQFMRNNVLLFRDATGTFYNDRWKPLVEGIMNVVLSVLFVKWVGVTGVIIATIITNLTICHIVEPYVLFKNAFHESPKFYYFKNYSMIVLFAIALGLLNKMTAIDANHWKALIKNGCVSVALSAVVSILVVLTDKNCRKILLGILKKQKGDRI